VATDPRLKRLQRQEAERLGVLLREAREKAGLTQGEMAQRLGRPQQYVSAAELGRQRLDLWELVRICRAIGVPLSDVIKRYEREAP
jgi:transcriptional regulator with XRE-family HTH domain